MLYHYLLFMMVVLFIDNRNICTFYSVKQSSQIMEFSNVGLACPWMQHARCSQFSLVFRRLKKMKRG